MKWRILTSIVILILAINTLMLAYGLSKLSERVSILEFNQQTILRSIEVK